MSLAGPQAGHGRSRGAADPARPGDALHPGADATGPSRAAGPPQEPRGRRQDTETPRVGPHLDTLTALALITGWVDFALFLATFCGRHFFFYESFAVCFDWLWVPTVQMEQSQFFFIGTLNL